MELSHIDKNGNAKMVDVSNKIETERIAVATGSITMKPETLELIAKSSMPKGDVLQTARIAGIMAAKHTWNLIPMCHNIPIDSIKVELSVNEPMSCVNIEAMVKCTWKTGVEMEALTAVTIAALTIYDMCKAVDKEMVVSDVKLIRKTGGKSGEYIRNES
ncbi:MAG: cyclic pyranopterin monophosphate synthase MoaC [Vallitaleaceae bacterium]|nr:cyclic pyranopterin monophosphate synthase MoaC [Vallitaleaceae bacterium]